MSVVARSDVWLRNLSRREREAYVNQAVALGERWMRAYDKGSSASSIGVQVLAQQQYEWIVEGRGGVPLTRDELVELADSYSGDPKQAALFGGLENAKFVGEALKFFADKYLPESNDA